MTNKLIAFQKDILLASVSKCFSLVCFFLSTLKVFFKVKRAISLNRSITQTSFQPMSLYILKYFYSSFSGGKKVSIDI